MVLKQIVRDKIMNEVIRDSGKTAGSVQYRVLVVDHLSMRIVSACCKMHEIVDEGITIVEDLMKKREPLPKFDAVYLISPVKKSVEALKKDFEDRPMYQNVHVYFTEVCAEELFNDLCNSKCAKRIKTLKEINVAFLPYEERVFTLDWKDGEGFDAYYNTPITEIRKAKLEKMADQMATLCATLGEYPNIRYRNDCKTNQELAQLLHDKLQAYKADDPSMGESKEKMNSQLIILDRGFDAVSPLLHELTYQAMAYELLEIHNDEYHFQTSKEKREALLDEKDEQWVKLRHRHIAEVLEEVPKNLKKFTDSKRVKSEKSNVKDISELIKKLPQHQKELSVYITHLSLSEDCMKCYRQKDLAKLCETEQNLALGVDSQGEKLRDAMKDSLTPVLLNNETATDYDKIRVILLYILHRNGITQNTLDKLFQHGGINPANQMIVANMMKLGVNIITDSGKKNYYQIPKKIRESRYQLSRWTPVMKDLIEAVVDDSLDESHFPFLKGRSSMQPSRGVITSARHGRWHQTNKQENKIREVPRLIIFIAGGITYSELRTAYEVAAVANWEVVVGSTHIIRPQDFLDQLKSC